MGVLGVGCAWLFLFLYFHGMYMGVCVLVRFMLHLVTHTHISLWGENLKIKSNNDRVLSMGVITGGLCLFNFCELKLLMRIKVFSYRCIWDMF